MRAHEVGIGVDPLNHDEEVVVSADDVGEELPRLDGRLEATDQEEEQLPELLEAAALRK